MKKLCLLILGMFLNSGVMAATVWAPTNPGDNVNIIMTASYSGSGILALFDDQNMAFSSPGLILNTNDTVMFTPTGSGYTATNGSGNSLFLSDTYNFILGMSLDNGLNWIGDTYTIELTGANAYLVLFSGVGLTLVADVQVVPLPAAFWLFSTALLGLFGFSARNKPRLSPIS